MSANLSSRAALAAAPLLLILAVSARAEERFSDQLAVTEVVVPVRVLVKGDPVVGLTRQDFELYDRGTRQEILGFEMLRSDPLAPREAASGGAATAAPPGRNLLLLVDFAFTRQLKLTRALGDLADSFADRLAPGDRLAIASYGELSGLSLLTGFSADRKRLRLAFEALEAMLAGGDRGQRNALEALHDARFGGGASTFEVLRGELGAAAALAVLSGPVVYDEDEDEGVTVERQRSIFGPVRVRVEVDRRQPVHPMQESASGVTEVGVRAFGLALAELTTLLREMPGRKELILLSEGLGGEPLRDARALYYLEKALRASRAGGWTIHALDAGGLGGLGERNFSADSLLFLTSGTGGDLIEGTNDFALGGARVLARTAVVYQLTFQPAEPAGDGEFRKLEVKLARRIKGAKLHYREGYYAGGAPARRDVFERRVDGAEWLLTNLEASELEVAVSTRTLIDPVGGGVRAPIALEVRGDSLLASGSRRSQRVEAQVVVEQEGALRALLCGEAVVDPARQREALHRSGVRFSGELGVPPGDYRLRVLVRNHRTGEVFLRTLPLTIGGEDAEAAARPGNDEAPEGWIPAELERRSGYFR